MSQPSSDSSSSSTYSHPDLDPDSIVATYHCVWMIATGEGKGACGDGMIRIIATDSASAPGGDEIDYIA